MRMVVVGQIMLKAAKVLNVVKGLLEIGDLNTRDIGIITPYNGQVRILSDLFQQAGGRDLGEPFHGLKSKVLMAIKVERKK